MCQYLSHVKAKLRSFLSDPYQLQTFDALLTVCLAVSFLDYWQKFITLCCKNKTERPKHWHDAIWRVDGMLGQEPWGLEGRLSCKSNLSCQLTWTRWSILFKGDVQTDLGSVRWIGCFKPTSVISQKKSGTDCKRATVHVIHLEWISISLRGRSRELKREHAQNRQHILPGISARARELLGNLW